MLFPINLYKTNYKNKKNNISNEYTSYKNVKNLKKEITELYNKNKKDELLESNNINTEKVYNKNNNNIKDNLNKQMIQDKKNEQKINKTGEEKKNEEKKQKENKEKENKEKENYVETAKENTQQKNTNLNNNQVKKNKNYEISYKVINDWGNAFIGEIYIHNTSNYEIKKWSLEFNFKANISSFWTVKKLIYNNNYYKVECYDWNSTIKPKEKISVGFIASPGKINSEPQNYKLNY